MSATTKNPAVAKAVFSSATDDWPTPQNFYDALDAEFGFVVDGCASTTNHKAPHYFALDHLDPSRRNGLDGDWAADAHRHQGSVFVNPPYGRSIGDWMAKAVETANAGATVVCLVPARTDTRWFHDHVIAAKAEVRFVQGRLKFGTATTSAPFANLVVIYRGRRSADSVTSRPQGHVKDVLELGNGDQVGPGPTGQQVLDGGAVQVSLAAGLGQAATNQRLPQVEGHTAGVAGGNGSVHADSSIGIGAGDIVGRDTIQAPAAGHKPHATATALPLAVRQEEILSQEPLYMPAQTGSMDSSHTPVPPTRERPMSDLATTPPMSGDRLGSPGGISRGQLSRRVQRVLTELLVADRWPNPDELAATLLPLVGKVLKEHRLTKADRAATIKVTGAAAAYCWEFLPDLTWSWQAQTTGSQGELPPLLWSGPHGLLVGDIVLAGLHRDPLESGVALANALREQVTNSGRSLSAVRLLTLNSPNAALLLTFAGGDASGRAVTFMVAALSTSSLGDIGGLGR